MNIQNVATIISKHARAHDTFGNGLMNVSIIRKLFPDAHVVKGFINFPTRSISVRHYFILGDQNEMIDPTVFTKSVEELEHTLSVEPMFETQQLDDERDLLFDQDNFWHFANPRCIVVLISVLNELGLKLEDYAIPVPRKIGVNEKCPCGSNQKYKKCHFAKSY